MHLYRSTASTTSDLEYVMKIISDYVIDELAERWAQKCNKVVAETLRQDIVVVVVVVVVCCCISFTGYIMAKIYQSCRPYFRRSLYFIIWSLVLSDCKNSSPRNGNCYNTPSHTYI
jgi:hypothetical protein